MHRIAAGLLSFASGNRETVNDDRWWIRLICSDDGLQKKSESLTYLLQQTCRVRLFSLETTPRDYNFSPLFINPHI